MRKLTLLFLIGCGVPPQEGMPLEPIGYMVIDSDLNYIEKDIPRLIELQSEAFGYDNWPAIAADTKLYIHKEIKAIDCNNMKVTGCISYIKDYNTAHMHLMVSNDTKFIEETAFSHEMTHLFACTVLGECDSIHGVRWIWEANDSAMEVFLSEVGKNRRYNKKDN